VVAVAHLIYILHDHPWPQCGCDGYIIVANVLATRTNLWGWALAAGGAMHIPCRYAPHALDVLSDGHRTSNDEAANHQVERLL
jgi:hypothetical protein